MASDGRMRLTDVADVETIFRLIQSIPSPKAEPFKLWLAKTGYEKLTGNKVVSKNNFLAIKENMRLKNVKALRESILSANKSKKVFKNGKDLIKDVLKK